jgi:hypothetical protein
MGITNESVEVINRIILLMMDKIASEAKNDLRDHSKMTLTAQQIQSATCSVLPDELRNCAVWEGTKAVVKFNSHE